LLLTGGSANEVLWKFVCLPHWERARRNVTPSPRSRRGSLRSSGVRRCHGRGSPLTTSARRMLGGADCGRAWSSDPADACGPAEADRPLRRRPTSAPRRQDSQHAASEWRDSRHSVPQHPPVRRLCALESNIACTFNVLRQLDPVIQPKISAPCRQELQVKLPYFVMVCDRQCLSSARCATILAKSRTLPSWTHHTAPGAVRESVPGSVREICAGGAFCGLCGLRSHGARRWQS